MKTPEQLKGSIRNLAKSRNLQAQEVLQMFMFERFIERLSISTYKNNFILKGGLLISSMIGIGERTTMDMDTTIRGIHMEVEEINRIVNNIIAMDIGDGIRFSYIGIQPIREDDIYNNFCVSLQGDYGKMKVPMKIDITTGDIITPSAVIYQYSLMFEERKIDIMAYNLETILAEKYETILRRNIANTRARDYYDIHMLYRLYRDDIRVDVLQDAIKATAVKRGSLEELEDRTEIIEEIMESEFVQNLWTNYCKDNPYVDGLKFDEVMITVRKLGSLLR